MEELVLAVIDRDVDTENYPFDNFSQALQNLKEDIILFSAERGLDIELKHRRRKIQHSDYAYTHWTEVYIEVNHDDAVWLSFVLPKKATANAMDYTNDRGWVFIWDYMAEGRRQGIYV